MLQSIAIGCLAGAVIILTYVCRQQQKEIDNIKSVVSETFEANFEIIEKLMKILIEAAEPKKKATKKKKGDK